MKKVIVHWLDAQSEDMLAIEAAEDLPTLERYNIGYLIAESKDEVRLAFGIVNNPDGSIAMYDKPLVIPRSMILGVENE